MTNQSGEIPQMDEAARDAEEIQRMRNGLGAFGAFAPEWYAPALRTIDRQAAEIESWRRDYEHLQSVNRQIANERDEAMRREEHNAKVIEAMRLGR